MKEILKKIGEESQLFGVRTLRFDGGRADGMRLIEMENGAGLVLELLPDRALDPYRLRYKGINLSFITNVSPVAPQFADNTDASFQKHFNAGLMTTCGLQNVGVANDYQGKHRTQHGRFSTIPADEVCAHTVREGDTPVMKAEGIIKEARFFGETLVDRRTVTMRYGENKIEYHDVVTNEGYEPQELMLLYHCNMGYPLVDADAQLLVPPTVATPRDEEAAKGVAEYTSFHEPVHNYAEQCFYLDCKPDEEGMVKVAMRNPHLKLALQLSFRKEELPFMTEWKQMGEKFYVVGIEPGCCHVEGTANEADRGTLLTLAPGESREFHLTFTILEGDEAMAL